MHTLDRRERLMVNAGEAAVIRTVLSGAALLCAGLPDGRRQILCLATPGEVVCPHLAAVPDIWVEALQSTCICELPIAALESDGAHAHMIMHAGNRFMASAVEHMLAIGRLDGTERVIAFLVDMTRRLGQRTNGHWRVDLPLSREDIADYLGLNPETVCRILSRIKRDGLVVFQSPTAFEVPNFDKLVECSPMVRSEPHLTH